jgi:hypothetical protein
MPVFYSSDFPRPVPGLNAWSVQQGLKLTRPAGIELAGSTLGALLDSLFKTTGIQVKRNDPPKYFRYHSPRDPDGYFLVDIHIERDGQEICVGQDLSFALLETDIVTAGMLAC